MSKVYKVIKSMILNVVFGIDIRIRKRMLKIKKNVIFQENVGLGENVYLEGANLLGARCCINRSFLGFASYIACESQIDKCNIGRYTCIGPYVRTIIGRHPTENFVSIHPIFFSTQKQIGFSLVNYPKFDEFAPTDQNGHSIHIGSDVWIGQGALIMDGITIGNGAVVGAGSLVNKDVPDYAIVAGVPARIVRYRFAEDEIEELKKIRWWEKDFTWVSEHVDDFEDIHKFLNCVKE